jgi:hypothetical protein
MCDYRSSPRSQRSLRRVRSFPIVADEDDVAAGQKKDQKVKKTKAVKKASQEAVSARNPGPSMYCVDRDTMAGWVGLSLVGDSMQWQARMDSMRKAGAGLRPQAVLHFQLLCCLLHWWSFIADLCKLVAGYWVTDNMCLCCCRCCWVCVLPCRHLRRSRWVCQSRSWPSEVPQHACKPCMQAVHA